MQCNLFLMRMNSRCLFHQVQATLAIWLHYCDLLQKLSQIFDFKPERNDTVESAWRDDSKLLVLRGHHAVVGLARKTVK